MAVKVTVKAPTPLDTSSNSESQTQVADSGLPTAQGSTTETQIDCVQYAFSSFEVINTAPKFVVPKSFTVVTQGAFLEAGSDYVIFLRGSDDQVTGDPVTSFGVVNGLFGMFRISDGAVSMSCPNYLDPSQPKLATGSGLSESAFVEEVKAVPLGH